MPTVGAGQAEGGTPQGGRRRLGGRPTLPGLAPGLTPGHRGGAQVSLAEEVNGASRPPVPAHDARSVCS